MRRNWVVLLSAAVTAAGGCGKANGPVEVHPVKGQVIYDGRPAAGVQVFFVPTSAPTVPRIPANPHGLTVADGTFAMTTYQPGDGAAEGGYQVVLLWPQDAKGDEEGSDVDRLLGWYGPVHSKLTASVQPGPNVLQPFRLAAVTRPPEAVQGIPGKN
jgi:hypothetical protein